VSAPVAARHAVLVVLFFLAATVFYTFPLILDPGHQLLVGLGDFPSEASMVVWNARQTFRDPGRLFQVPFYYPYGNGVAYQQSAFFTGLLAAPLLGLGAEPVLAVNFVLLAELVASGALTYLLAYSITRRVEPSLLAGVVFAFYPNRMDHIGQFTYQQAFLFPLIVWAVCRFLLQGSWRSLALATAGMWAQILSSLYNGYALGLLLVALTAAILLLRPECLTWRSAAQAATAGLVLALALLPFVLPYVAVNRELGFQRTLREAEHFGMDLLSILDPGEFSRFYRDRLVSLHRSEGGLFPGFVALALAAAGVLHALLDPERAALPAWARLARRLVGAGALAALGAVGLALSVGKLTLSLGGITLLRLRKLTLALALLPGLALAWVALEGRRRRGALTLREWTMVALFLTCLTYLLCLAPTLRVGGKPWGTSLFHWVYVTLPGGSAFRAPGRWSLVFVLPLAILVALGARAVADRLPRRWARIVPGVLLAGLLLEYVIVPVPWVRLPDIPAVYDWLKNEPGDFAILQVPLYERASDAWAMLWALHHGKRVVNGHGGFALATWNELVTAAESRDPERVASSIQSIYPVRYVVTHPHLLGPVWFPVWQLMQQGAVAPLRHIQTFGADEVYEVMATPEVGTEIRRYFASDLVRRLPVAAYTLRLSGEDPEIHRRVTVHFNSRLLSTHEGPARTRAPLAPPFPRADRNELVFRHVYDVRAAIARGDGYRIGRTTVHSPVDIEVQSAGKAFGDVASIRVNGHEFVPAPRRGYWVAALAPADGRVLSVEKFDTHRSVGESEGFARHLANLGPGTIVVVTAMDETAWQLTEAAVRALRVVGGHGDLRGTFGLSHLVVGVRGAAPGEAVELWGPQFLRAVVGRRRPVGLLLEAFDLVRDGPSKNRP
jgi:hypothetical protein